MRGNVDGAESLLKPAGVQNHIDKLVHVLGLGQNSVKFLPDGRLEIILVQESPQRRVNQGKRRTEFVRNVGEELQLVVRQFLFPFAVLLLCLVLLDSVVDKQNACNQCRKQQDGSGYVCYVPAPVLADMDLNPVPALYPPVCVILVGNGNPVSSG